LCFVLVTNKWPRTTALPILRDIVFGVQDSYSVLDLSRTETWLPQRGPQVYLYSFNNLFWQTQVFDTSSIRGVKDCADPDINWIPPDLSKHRRSCGTSYIRKWRHRAPAPIDSSTQPTTSHSTQSIISAHRTLFLNITWHRTEAHSGTRSFHHQLHLGYQLTSQVITFDLSHLRLPPTASIIHSETQGTSTVWRPLHHCLHIGNFFSRYYDSLSRDNSRDKLKICVPNQHSPLYTYTTWLLSSSITPLYQTQLKSFAAFDFISFLGNIFAYDYTSFCLSTKWQQTPHLLIPGRFASANSKKAPAIFSGHYAEIDTFLKEFAMMADAYNLNNGDRFDTILRYVTCPVKRSWRTTWIYHEGLEGLSKLPPTAYNHVKMEKRYKEKDLVTFIRKRKAKPSDLSSTTMIISANSFVLEDGSTKTKRSLRSNITGTFGKELTILTTTSRESDVSKQSQTFTSLRHSFNRDYCSGEPHLECQPIRWWCLLRRRWQGQVQNEASDSEDEEEMAQLLKSEKRSWKKKEEVYSFKSWSSSPTSSKAIPDETDEIADLIDELNKSNWWWRNTQQSISVSSYAHTDDTFFERPRHTHSEIPLAPIQQVQFWPQPSQQQHPRPLHSSVIFAGKQGTAFAGVSSVRTWFQLEQSYGMIKVALHWRRVKHRSRFQRKYPYSSQSGISSLGRNQQTSYVPPLLLKK